MRARPHQGNSRFAMSLCVFLLAFALGTAQAKEALVEPLAVPPVERVTLDNGLTILIIENHQVPYAAFRLLFKVGSLQEPEGMDGLARLTSTLLTYGTTSRTEDEISEQTDLLGASLGASASRTSIQTYGDVTTVRPDHLESFFSLMSDVVLHPTFPKPAVERVKTRRLGALAAMRDDNGSLADRAFHLLLFNDHPFGHPVAGHPATIERITRDDIVDFHKRHFLPEHAVLGVAGDVDPAQIVRWAESTFGADAWGSDGEKRICVPSNRASTCEAFVLDGDRQKNQLLVTPPAAKNLSDGVRIVIVDKDDPSLNQVQWRLGHQGTITYDNPQWYNWRLATHVVGGDFTARLNQILRVREGLTYGARLHVGHHRHVPGRVAVSTYVKPKDLRRAIELAVAELERAISTPMAAEEVANFQSKLIESLPFRFETASHILSEHIGLLAGDLPTSFLTQYPIAISEVTPQNALKALQTGLNPQALLLVAVGNRDLVTDLQPIIDARGGSIEVIPVDALFDE